LWYGNNRANFSEKRFSVSLVENLKRLKIRALIFQKAGYFPEGASGRRNALQPKLIDPPVDPAPDRNRHCGKNTMPQRPAPSPSIGAFFDRATPHSERLRD
jgi:hypothetical protein